MDLAQNKLINRVKRENDKLTRTVQELGKELHDFENQSQKTDQEVARLKDLSSKLKPAGELQQQAVKASQEEVQKMLHDLDSLKNKPGIDPQKFNELRKEIEKVKTNAGSEKHIQELSTILTTLKDKPQVDSDYFEKITKRLQNIEQHDATLRKDLENKLAKKEERFKHYVSTTGKGMSDYSKKFKDMQSKLGDMEDRATDIMIGMHQSEERLKNQAADANEQIAKLATMMSKMSMKPTQPKHSLASQLANTQNQDDQAEVHQAMAGPSENEPQYGLKDMDKLQNRFNKRPLRNVKMAEQIEMMGDEDDFMDKELLTQLVRRYQHFYPRDLSKWSRNQLIKVITDYIGKLLLLSQNEEPTVQEADQYLRFCHDILRKYPPAQQDWISQGSMNESMFNEFLTNVDRLSNGF
jgi:chromosome segregation ATPase